MGNRALPRRSALRFWRATGQAPLSIRNDKTPIGRYKVNIGIANTIDAGKYATYLEGPYRP